MIFAIVKRIVIQTLRDKRTVALMMIAPLLIMTLINYLFNSLDSSELKLGTYNTTDYFIEELEKDDIDVVKYGENDDIDQKIVSDELDGFIYMNNNKINVTYNNIDTTCVGKISAKVQKIVTQKRMQDMRGKIDDISKKIAKANPEIINNEDDSSVIIENNYLYGDENLSYFDTLNPILIGFFVFFFVFLIAGISILNERTSKTLEKLLATPIRRHQIIVGYLFGYGIFAVVQTCIIVIYSICVLDINVAGNIFLVILTNVLIAFVALSLGILLSTFADSEFQIMQFIPIVIVPQLFFTGIISIDTLNPFFQNLAKIMPLYYGSQSLQDIMIKGSGFLDVAAYLLALVIMTVVFSVLNIIGLRKFRKI